MSDPQRAIRGRWRAKLQAALRLAAKAKRVIARHPTPKPQPKPVPKPPGPISRFGIDYAWGKPSDIALKNEHVSFVCRYLSHDAKKNLTRNEALRLSGLEIDIVVVWESTANRALEGSAAGAEDAKVAVAQAKACGMPATKPIYFGVDFDEKPANAKAVAGYFSGVASVLGVQRTGVYGGYWAVKRLFDAKLVAYGWQTYAWSGGNWDPRAQIHQYKNGQTINGVGVDFNRSVHADFGQWRTR